MKEKPFGMPDNRIQRFYFNQSNGTLRIQLCDRLALSNSDGVLQ